MSKENTTNTFIACGTWLKTPFYTSSAGVELPLGTQRIPHPLSLLFKSGAYLCGQMCLHKLVSTLSRVIDKVFVSVVYEQENNNIDGLAGLVESIALTEGVAKQ